MAQAGPSGAPITATNEPQRIKCGAPDFIITRGAVTIGYLECKDIDKSLADMHLSMFIDKWWNERLRDNPLAGMHRPGGGGPASPRR